MPRLFGIEIAHAGGERREPVDGLVVGTQRQRLNVVLKIGMRARRIAAHEGAELRGRHAHGPRAAQRVFKSDGEAAPETARDDIQRAHTAHLEHRPDLQMVLQIRAHAAKVVEHFDAVLAQ